MEKVFRDPVHNLISFDHERDGLVLDLIETRELQRLRQIKLMGVSYVVYPGADHNRFSHSLGVAFLTKRILAQMESFRGDSRFKTLLAALKEHRELLLAAALLHDIGHFPLSHLLEGFTGQSHEDWTVKLVRDPASEVHQVLRDADTHYPDQVAQIIARTFKPSFAVKLISSQLDVDRMDYLLRDSYHTGVGYGQFDLEWLLHSLRIVEHDGDWEVAVDEKKGLRAVESYVLARYYMYQQVYHHKTSRAAGVMLLGILRRAAELLKDGEPIFSTEALQELLLVPVDLTREAFLQLDDPALTFALQQWSGSDDEILSDLCQRFLRRRIFKTLEVEAMAYRQNKEKLAALARRSGFEPDYYLVIDTAISDPYSDGLLQGDQRQAEAGQGIYLADETLRLTELSQHSPLIQAVTNRTFVRDRLCFPEELREKIGKIIGQTDNQGA
jgi:HD superfamily phosphohydrolase